MVAACSLLRFTRASMAFPTLAPHATAGQNPQLRRRSTHTIAMSSDLEALLQEHRKFEPADAFRAARRGRQPGRLRPRSGGPRGLLGRAGGEARRGSRRGTRVLDWKPPHAQWFVGGTLNASRELPRPAHPRRRAATRRRSCGRASRATAGRSPTGTSTSRSTSSRNVLRSLGVKQGDRVAIYLPMIPEAAIAMLACARIGAIHSVVFGGFSPESLRDRINDSQCKVLITADGGYRRGQVVPLKRNADKALEETPVDRARGRRAAPARRRRRRGVRRDAGGTRPLVAPPHARRADVVRAGADGRRGRAVHPLHLRHDRQAEGDRAHHRRLPHRRCDDHASIVFDLKEDDVYWCTADIGWVTGHYVPRVRAARQRRDVRDVRGRARLAGEGPLLGDLRAATA